MTAGLKILSRYEMIPADALALATKFAAAQWMMRHDATEKSFYRLKARIRHMLIADAGVTIQKLKELGIKVELETE